MSLRVRLLLATGVVALVALLIVDVATYVTLSGSQLKQVDDALDTAHQPLEQLAQDGRPAALESIPEVAPATYVAIVDADGRAKFVSPVIRAGDDSISVDVAALDLGAGDDRRRGVRRVTVASSDGDEVRLRIDPLTGGRALVTGQSLHELNETRTRLVGVLVVATGAAVGFAVLLGWALVRLGLRPLRQMEVATSAISDDGLGSQRVPGHDPRTEVGRLATTINAMLDRLDDARTEREQTVAELRSSEERMRRFVADASHELRTPVAATGAYAELFEAGARDRPADLERVMRGIRTETARMAGLVDDLLLLARLDEDAGISVERMDLTEVALAAVDTACTLEPTRSIEVSIGDVIEIDGDPVRLRQVVDNLLGNIRTHTAVDVPAMIDLRATDAAVVLTVSDFGPGLPDADLARVFDRFYRSDPARTRVAGGSGLGLSIVASIVESHGGTIGASSNTPTGLRITVTLPARSMTAMRGL